jgi:hypothetical protein
VQSSGRQSSLGKGEALGTVIQLCSRCGFDIPPNATVCPECGPDVAAVPSRAARQVAGADLPTRSVWPLPHTSPARDLQPREVTPAVGARTAFAYTWVLVVVALVGALLAHLARLDRYVSSLPNGTAEWFEDLTVMATLGSVIGLVVGLVAMVVWCIRRVVIEVTRRQHHPVP